jgi:pimeloyl-ACP methyl ester carboxylesterase
MGEDNVRDFKAALKGVEIHKQAVEASASKLLHADLETLTQAIQSLLCPSDAAVLATDFADFVLRSVREGVGQSRDGMIDDDIAHLTPWGFELSQIRIPVLHMHGERDLFVPVSHSKWLASKIPNVETVPA